VTAHSWLESIKVAPGGEASWHGGELRLWLDRIGIRSEIQRSWLARLFGRPDVPAMCEVSARLAMPGRPAFACSITAEFPSGFPALFGPSWMPSRWPWRDSAPLFAVQHGATFEVREIVENGAAAIVRAGLTETQADIAVTGDIAALDPAARRFVSWWLAQPSAERWAGAGNAALGYPLIPGYGLRLIPLSSDSRTATFHRDGERFFVRTYGGCLRPEENWYGPFVEGDGGYRISAGFRVELP
jgi:hypothetical protein